MSNLTVFNFNTSSVRVLEIDGEPWFVAKDLCDILEIKNVSDSLSRLDSDEKSTIVLNDGTPGNPEKSIVSESGMYALVLSSRKPEAKPFRKWVTSEVLPSIRKTGKFEAEQKPKQLPPAIEYSREIQALSENTRVPAALKQLLLDKMGDELSTQGQLPQSSTRLIGVAQKAEEMGFKIDHAIRCKLGKFARTQGLNSTEEYRFCNGQTRLINCYPDDENLEKAIQAFFN